MRVARVDKRDQFIVGLVSQAEDSANRSELGKVHNITKMVCGKYSGRRLLVS